MVRALAARRGSGGRAGCLWACAVLHGAVSEEEEEEERVLSTTGCLTPCCCPGEWERGLRVAVSSASMARISRSISYSTQQRLRDADGAFLVLLFTLKPNDCTPNTSHQRPCQSSLKCHQWMESPGLPELMGAHRPGCTTSWRPKLALGDVLGEQSSGCSPPAGQEGCCEGTRRNCSTSEPRGESWDRPGHIEMGWDPHLCPAGSVPPALSLCPRFEAGDRTLGG